MIADTLLNLRKYISMLGKMLILSAPVAKAVTRLDLILF